MENMENMKACVEVYSTGASTNASTSASMEVMEAFVGVMKASTEVTSMEA